MAMSTPHSAASSAPVVEVRDVTRRFGGLVAVDGVSLTVARGSITGLIGPNGAGKTTLFSLIAGSLTPSRGEIWIDSRPGHAGAAHERMAMGLARTFQIPKPFAAMTVLENVLVAFQQHPGEKLLSNWLCAASVAREERRNIEEARQLIAFVALGHLADQPARVLSGGQRQIAGPGACPGREARRHPARRACRRREPRAARNHHRPHRRTQCPGHELPADRKQHGPGEPPVSSRLCDGTRPGAVPWHAAAGDGRSACHRVLSGRRAVTPILTVAGMSAGYEPGIAIIEDASIHARDGEILLLLGPNGAGKSTLVKAIAGLVQKSAGVITLAGQDISQLPAQHMIAHGLAFVPQTENVFVSMSISETLALAANQLPRAERRQALERLYGLFPDLDRLRGHLAGRLSGGQRQMVAIARAMVIKPRVLMPGEPWGGVWPKRVEALFGKLIEVRATGVTIVMVEQNVRAALAIADRAYILVDGRPCHEGNARTLADDPAVAHLYLGLKGASHSPEELRA